MSHSEKVKGQLLFVLSGVQHFTERFKQKDSMRNTSAITAVTVFHEAMTQCYRISSPLNSGEWNKAQRRTKVSIGAAAVGEKAHLGKKVC